MKHRFYILFVLIALPFLVFSQGDDSGQAKKKKKHFLQKEEDRKTFDKAEYYFGEQNYQQAMVLYKKLEQDFPEERVLLFRLGVCYVNAAGDKSKSLDYLGRLDKKKFKKTDFLYYLGRANHLNYRFDEAVVLYNEFKASKRGKGKEKQIDRMIADCITGKEMYTHPVKAEITNLGPPVNTENSEYCPTVSSDEYTLIYTYTGPRCMGGLQSEPGKQDESGQYLEDIFESHKDSAGHWAYPDPIATINTDGPDAAIALSNDGQKLLVFRNSPGDIGDIYMSKLEGTRWSEPERLKGDVNTDAWEGSASLSPDERTLYFSSERPGGFGGRDIYSAVLQADGSWGNVKNLGPKINSEYNDDSPVIAPDGVSLFFNSDGHPGMGGNDIFVSVQVDDSVWLDPINLGYPINTPDDDLYFYPVADGNRGYYSSGKAGGFGQQDIYLVEGLGRKTRLVMVKGTVTVDDKAVDATITVVDEKKKTEFTRHSNTVTGKYLMNMKPGSDFKIVYKTNGFDEQVKHLNTEKVDSFLESTIDVQFFTEAYKARMKRIQDSLALIKDTTAGKTPSMTLAEMISKYGDVKVEGLEYRVQVGAFNLSEHFNYSALFKIGKIQKNKGEDGITRFTVGKVSTLNEVYALKKKVINAGIKDAFVTAVYKKKRMLLKDLLLNHIYETK
jgi:tetratricopeptide (TPR) repeat protein